MKDRLIYLLHRLLGYRTYLFVYAWYKVWSIRLGRSEFDFRAFLELVPDGGVVLDIGANLGVMSVLLGERLPSARVLAFEPIPSNFETAARVLRHFGRTNVELFDVALGAGREDLEMILPLRNGVRKHGLGRVVQHGSRRPGERFRVPQERLDDYLDRTERVAAIKIDVENHEYEVLSNGIALLERDRPLVFCELWDNEVREHVLGMFRRLGYAVKVVEREEVVDYDPERHVQRNFLLLPEDRPQRADRPARELAGELG